MGHLSSPWGLWIYPFQGRFALSEVDNNHIGWLTFESMSKPTLPKSCELYYTVQLQEIPQGGV